MDPNSSWQNVLRSSEAEQWQLCCKCFDSSSHTKFSI